MKVKTIITHDKQANVYRIKAYHEGKIIESYDEYANTENVAKLAAVLFEILADYVDNIEDFNYNNYYLITTRCVNAFNFVANIDLVKQILNIMYYEYKYKESCN